MPPSRSAYRAPLRRACNVDRAPRVLSPGRRVRRPRARQRHSLDATATQARRSSRDSHRSSSKWPRIGTSRRSRRARSSRSPRRRTGPAASSPRASSPSTEYWYRFTDEDGNGSRIGRTLTAPQRKRRAPGALHVRELPGHDDRRRERLSPHDLRGRAPPARRAARLRAAPRRLHLRGGELRGRDAGGQVPRPPPAPAVQVPRRRQVPRLPPARDARGLPHGVPRLSHRPRPAGRARPLAVRSGVGQPRVLVAGIPGHPGVRRRAAPRADQEGRGQPGVVGIPAGACRAARR